ncbi:hypothetical protein ACFB49_31110 [Sphingomonas sp. DBB INV C78]|uniref:DUF6118 family protein n=1 Tax=Sphingomonas sp. DBB INV C78 TaxID=3349434 RepID=UPI0036D3C4D1
MDRNASPEADAARAFEDLRGEVALLRRATEQLAAEHQAVPDYSRTLVEMSTRLKDISEWSGHIASLPAMRLSPVQLVQELEKAGQGARREDSQTIREAGARLDEQVKQLKTALQGARNEREQARTVRRSAGYAFALGVLLWSFLPGTIARMLPVSWHLPERMAAGIMNTDRWEGGQRMMASEKPASWNRIGDAAQKDADARPEGAQ